MASLSETQARHAQDLVNGNMAALMGDFTPNAMTKVMARHVVQGERPR
ncbi:MAG TPA: hypothetical protein PKD27_06090 [Tepidiformaceae bacterium]|nr:hypothetical protein [Tepidiformaceae bacterium]